MLGVIIANSLLLLFMCWEIVGLTSYLLIGFWYHKRARAAAAKKAFLTTRVGDIFFLLGIVWLFAQTGTLLFLQQWRGRDGAGSIDDAAQPARRAWADGRRRNWPASSLPEQRARADSCLCMSGCRCDGRPDAGVRAHSRGHDGGAGGISSPGSIR